MAGTSMAMTTSISFWASSIQREGLRIISAEVRRRVQRLAIDRAILVLAPERWVPDLRRIGVIGELALAGQNFGAGVEPGAFCHVDPGPRPLLIGHVGAARSVIGAAPVVISGLRLRARGGDVEAKRNNSARSQQHRKLVRSREFPGHHVLTGGRTAISDLESS